MTLPSVSIVILSHNYRQYVGNALASAVAQKPGDYRLAEVVVIDDGSTDGSHEVYAQFLGVRVVRKAHEGFGPTLTRAVREAVGDWIAPLDADDSFVPNKLHILAPFLHDPDLLFLQHAEHVIDAEGHPFAEGVHPGGSTSTLLVRSQAVRDLLPVTNELFFHVLADLGHGVQLPEPLTRYRVHATNMTDRRTPGAFADYMAGVCAHVAARLDELRDNPPTWATAGQLGALAEDYRDRAVDQHAEAERQRERAGTRTGGEGTPL